MVADEYRGWHWATTLVPARRFSLNLTSADRQAEDCRMHLKFSLTHLDARHEPMLRHSVEMIGSKSLSVSRSLNLSLWPMKEPVEIELRRGIEHLAEGPTG